MECAAGVVSRVDAQIYVHSRSKGVANDTLRLDEVLYGVSEGFQGSRQANHGVGGPKYAMFML